MASIDTNPRRLLWVGTFPGAGSYSIGQDLAERLRERGWQIELTSTKRSGLARVWDMLWTAWSKRSTYDVAHVDVYSGRAFVWAEAVCALLHGLHKPYVLTLRGGGLPDFAKAYPNRVKRVLRSARVVTAPSSFLQKAMRRFAPRIEVLPNALDLSAYANGAPAKPSADMIWLRAFHEAYNPTMGPAVLKAVASRIPDARLCMVGPDKGDGSLHRTQTAAESLGVADRIELLAGIPKAMVPSYLSDRSIFLNTTNVDNTPVSLLEAMASGLCVVSTNAGGIPNLATHGEDAILVDTADVEAMASAVVDLVENPAKFETLSKQARRSAERFDWSKILPQWESLFERILNNA